MFSIGNDELDALPEIDMTEEIACRKCGKMLLPDHHEDANGELITAFAFIYCDKCDSTWLVAVKGKKLDWEE